MSKNIEESKSGIVLTRNQQALARAIISYGDIKYRIDHKMILDGFRELSEEDLEKARKQRTVTLKSISDLLDLDNIDVNFIANPEEATTLLQVAIHNEIDADLIKKIVDKSNKEFLNKVSGIKDGIEPGSALQTPLQTAMTAKNYEIARYLADNPLVELGNVVNSQLESAITYSMNDGCINQSNYEIGTMLLLHERQPVNEFYLIALENWISSSPPEIFQENYERIISKINRHNSLIEESKNSSSPLRAMREPREFNPKIDSNGVISKDKEPSHRLSTVLEPREIDLSPKVKNPILIPSALLQKIEDRLNQPQETKKQDTKQKRSPVKKFTDFLSSSRASIRRISSSSSSSTSSSPSRTPRSSSGLSDIESPSSSSKKTLSQFPRKLSYDTDSQPATPKKSSSNRGEGRSA